MPFSGTGLRKNLQSTKYFLALLLDCKLETAACSLFSGTTIHLEFTRCLVPVLDALAVILLLTPVSMCSPHDTTAFCFYYWYWSTKCLVPIFKKRVAGISQFSLAGENLIPTASCAA